ncbi:unnamed protein product [Mesocestoides corti]|nr:unnamed protein product [Mesocestoides corti]
MLRKFDVFASEDVIRPLACGNSTDLPSLQLRLTTTTDLIYTSEDPSRKCPWSEVPFVTVVVERQHPRPKEPTNESPSQNGSAVTDVDASTRFHDLASRLEIVEKLLSSSTPIASNGVTSTTKSPASHKTKEPSSAPSKQPPSASAKSRRKSLFADATGATPLPRASQKRQSHYSNGSSDYIWQTPASFLANFDEVIESVVAGLDDPNDFTIEPASRQTAVQDSFDYEDLNFDSIANSPPKKKKRKTLT